MMNRIQILLKIYRHFNNLRFDFNDLKNLRFEFNNLRFEFNNLTRRLNPPYAPHCSKSTFYFAKQSVERSNHILKIMCKAIKNHENHEKFQNIEVNIFFGN